jgi:4-amino-4-deoxy-L-arabinose transferase-like glycosyltransferase
VVVLCLVLYGVLFAWNTWEREFWRPDEPRYAELTRQMESTGDWIVPRLYGEPYLDVPPLVSWLGGASHLATGLDPKLSYRLPVVLAAIFGLWLTYLAGRKLFDGRIGFLAATLQASTLAMFSRAAWLDDDLLFAVCVQLAFTSFALLSRRGSSTRWAYAGWLGIAGCALTKSLLLAVVLVVPPLVLFLFFEGGVDSVKFGLRRARNVKAICLFLLLAAPWYVAVSLSNAGTLLDAHLLGQHVGRLVASAQDARPAYYYLLRVFPDFFPWCLFIPLALLHGKDRMARDGQRLCMFWAILMLILLSFVSSKKPGFLLVIWPALSLLVAAAFFEGREWFSLWEDYLRQGVFRIFPVLLKVPLFVVLIAAGAYLGGYTEKFEDPRLQRLLSDRESVLWILGLLAAAGALLFLAAGRVRRFLREKALPRAAFEVACAVLFLLFSLSFLYEGRNALQSSRAVLEQFSDKIPARTPVAVYGRADPEIAYYLETPEPLVHLDYPETLKKRAENPNYVRIREFLERPETVFVVSTREELEALLRQFSSLGKLVDIQETGMGGGGREYVLAINAHP